MSSDTEDLIRTVGSTAEPAKGDYVPSTNTDLRSPCPMVNCLANHGYLPRNGRHIHSQDFMAALSEVGISTGIRAAFSYPIYLEHTDASTTGKPSFFTRIFRIICHPFTTLLGTFGMRPAGQVDTQGKLYLNLDQLALHGAVEHDISLTRHDIAQGDNWKRQPDLIKGLLESSSDGGATLSLEDLVGLRRRRIEEQRRINPTLTYTDREHQVGCAEIALILKVLGDGQKVRCDFVRAFFEEERLPLSEGWKARKWWTVGFLEMDLLARRIKQLIGIKV